MDASRERDLIVVIKADDSPLAAQNGSYGDMVVKMTLLSQAASVLVDVAACQQKRDKGAVELLPQRLNHEVAEARSDTVACCSHFSTLVLAIAVFFPTSRDVNNPPPSALPAFSTATLFPNACVGWKKNWKESKI